MIRRTVLKVGVVLAATSQTSISVAETPDRIIIDLARAFEAAYAAQEAARAVCRETGDWTAWEAAFARTESIVDLIEEETATTLEGLRAKARCIQWCFGDEPVDLAVQDTTDARLATQIVNALLKI